MNEKSSATCKSELIRQPKNTPSTFRGVAKGEVPRMKSPPPPPKKKDRAGER